MYLAHVGLTQFSPALVDWGSKKPDSCSRIACTQIFDDIAESEMQIKDLEMSELRLLTNRVGFLHSAEVCTILTLATAFIRKSILLLIPYLSS
jgi:hypothetical protein